MSTRPGKFITLEGIDGAGKSSHIELIKSQLEQAGVNLVVTREPGGTPLGEKLRAILLSEKMHPRTEALLMIAQRNEHIENVIWPAIQRGDWVLSDRFSDSSYAFQGAAKGIGIHYIKNIERDTMIGIEPHLTLLFDVNPEVGQARMAGRELDKFEKESLSFHYHVREAYLKLAKKSPGRFKVIDAGQEYAGVQKDVLSAISSIL